MARKKQKDLNSIIEECRVKINNSINDPIIKQALLNFGTTEEYLLQGQTLFAETNEWMSIQEKEYAEQYAATNEFYTAFELSKKELRRFLTMIRIKFKNNNDAMTLLKAEEGRKDKFKDWYPQNRDLFTKFLERPDFISVLEPFGFTAEKVTEMLTDLNALAVLQEKQEQEKGDAQLATQRRNAKLEELLEWTSDHTQICRLVFEDEPQHLEKLGILVRS